MGLIYKATSPSSKSYIGQTNSLLEIRKNQHKSASATKDSPFYRAIRKYGFKNFTWKILEEGIKNQDELDQREVYWIKEFGTFSKEYNATTGGWGGKKSEKTRAKYSAIQRKRFANPENNPMYGRHHTEATRKLQSKIAKQRNFSGSRNPMYRKKRPDLTLRNLTDNPMKDPLSREKMSTSQKKRLKDPAAREKIAAGQRGKKRTKEWCEQHSKDMKEFWLKKKGI